MTHTGRRDDGRQNTGRHDAAQHTPTPRVHPANWAPNPQYNEIRATYDEFRVGQTTVVMFNDPMHTNAWVQSDVTMPVQP